MRCAREQSPPGTEAYRRPPCNKVCLRLFAIYHLHDAALAPTHTHPCTHIINDAHMHTYRTIFRSQHIHHAKQERVGCPASKSGTLAMAMHEHECTHRHTHTHIEPSKCVTISSAELISFTNRLSMLCVCMCVCACTLLSTQYDMFSAIRIDASGPTLLAYIVQL